MERLLSSPFLRWLLENHEMLKGEGALNELLMILGMLAQGTPVAHPGPAPMMMMPGAPGMSMEQASPENFAGIMEVLRGMMGHQPGTTPGRR